MQLALRRPTLIGLMHAAAALTALFSVATLADSLHRYLELFSHFRLQYLAASLLLLLIFTALRNRTWAGLMLVITVVNTVPVAPWYFPETRRHADGDPQIELLLANVYSANGNAEALLDLIDAERPDIIFLQEVTNRWAVVMDQLHSAYPHRLVVPRSDNFGIAVYAREPLTSVDTVVSPPLDFPTLVVQQSLGGRTVTIVTTHPIPPVSRTGFDARNEQLASIAELVAPFSGPKMIVGDLNISMWSHLYRQLEESTDLVNARRGFGVVPTWPRYLPFAMIPIDHILMSKEFAVVDIRRGPKIGSDHLPLLATLALLER